MMTSLLPVISEQIEQTNKEKYVFYCSVSRIHINLEKNTEMTFSHVPKVCPTMEDGPK